MKQCRHNNERFSEQTEKFTRFQCNLDRLSEMNRCSEGMSKE
jgi:hypothetical protein